MAAPSDAGPIGSVAVPVGALLDRVDLPADATHVTAVSDDGAYTASIPLDDARSGGRLYVGDVGTLGRSMGGPFRLIVHEGSTLCWNVKAVGEFRLTDGPEPDSVPESPTH